MAIVIQNLTNVTVDGVASGSVVDVIRNKVVKAVEIQDALIAWKGSQDQQHGDALTNAQTAAAAERQKLSDQHKASLAAMQANLDVLQSALEDARSDAETTIQMIRKNADDAIAQARADADTQVKAAQADADAAKQAAADAVTAARQKQADAEAERDALGTKPEAQEIMRAKRIADLEQKKAALDAQLAKEKSESVAISEVSDATAESAATAEAKPE